MSKKDKPKKSSKQKQEDSNDALKTLRDKLRKSKNLSSAERRERERAYWTDNREILESDPGRALFDLPEIGEYGDLKLSDFHNVIDAWDNAIIDIAQAMIEHDRNGVGRLLQEYRFDRLENLICLAMEHRQIDSDSVFRLGEVFRNVDMMGDFPHFQEKWQRTFNTAHVAIERLKKKLVMESAGIISQPKNMQANKIEIENQARLSARELAELYKVSYDFLRKRLERWRLTHDEGYINDSNAKSRASRFVYRVGAIKHIIQSLKASDKASIKRPSKKI